MTKRRRPAIQQQDHQLRIAIDTMRLSCIGARIMGGPNHAEAVRIIGLKTGRQPFTPAGCECDR